MNDLSQAHMLGAVMPEFADEARSAPSVASDAAHASTASAESARFAASLDTSITRATEAILAVQKPDGHWVYELEADATIPAEYVLLVHYLGETPNVELEQKIARYLRRIQLADGGWPLFTDGAMDVSASVKAYFALKMIGDPVDAEHMVRARECILAHGGAEAANVFTRILLALFGVVTWYAVPMMPVEIMLLPKWFPFHLSKVSYWARTVIVPLLVLNAKRPVARNPRGVRIDELFRGAPVTTGLLPRSGHQSKSWFAFFRAVDGVLRVTDGLFPSSPFRRSSTKSTAALIARSRERAIKAAVDFVDERLNGEDGNRPSVTRSTPSTARKNANQLLLWWPERGSRPVVTGAPRNSSSIRTPRGLRATGRFAFSTSSGTITVRAQYDTFDRWNGNHFGSSMISTGIIGTAYHVTTPNSASRMRVNTFAASAPPWARMHSRARTICSASTGSPIIFSAKYAFTLALTSIAPSVKSGQPPSASWMRRK